MILLLTEEIKEKGDGELFIRKETKTRQETRERQEEQRKGPVGGKSGTEIRGQGMELGSDGKGRTRSEGKDRNEIQGQGQEGEMVTQVGGNYLVAKCSKDGYVRRSYLNRKSYDLRWQ